MKLLAKVEPFIGVLFVLVGAIFFSGKAIFVKLGLQAGASVMTLLNLRMLFALPFFITMAIISEKRNQVKIAGKDWAKILFLGISGYYLASYFDFQGLKHISAGLERLIIFLYPTIVVVLSALIYKTPVRKSQIIALALTYIGVIIAFSGATEHFNKNILVGSLLIFASAFSYAIYLIGSGKLIPKLGAIRFTSYGMIISTLAVLVHSNITGTFTLIASTKVYLFGLGMGILCTVIPAILLAEGIKRIGSSATAIVGSIGPVSTIILAAIILNEKITVLQIVGTFIVIGGVVFVSRKSK